MNVCYIITSAINAGPVNVLFNMLDECINNFSIKPWLICLENDIPANRSIRNKFRNLGVHVVQFNIKDIDKIVSFIKENNIKVVHSHGLKPDLLNLMIKIRTRNGLFNCSTLHNFPYEDYVPLFGKVKGRLLATLHVLISKRLYSIACSRSIQDKYKEIGIDTDLVENGVKFPEIIGDKRIKSGRKFLYVGELIKRKNLTFLIKIFKNLTEFDLTIVGDGVDYDFLREMSLESNNIHFQGRIENPTRYYQETDYYISASLSEGLPMSILEALSFGKPLLLSDIPAHRSIINEGENGELFKLTDHDIVEKINEITKENFDSKSIYETAKKYYSSYAMTRHYKKIYMENLR
ncbi:glycosyltransferase family 4 protein [Ligilactobacillus aviarius]|uniref:glycosyltransferase family 4 protein n=1 Tax=Ligilactobacillus aviarius TaxID=1606 RepID=UPI0024BAE735|nr:glycosyltransferase family 4 protein [Ligilactobacillus aviarius]